MVGMPEESARQLSIPLEVPIVQCVVTFSSARPAVVPLSTILVPRQGGNVLLLDHSCRNSNCRCVLNEVNVAPGHASGARFTAKRDCAALYTSDASSYSSSSSRSSVSSLSSLDEPNETTEHTSPRCKRSRPSVQR